MTSSSSAAAGAAAAAAGAAASAAAMARQSQKIQLAMLSWPAFAASRGLSMRNETPLTLEGTFERLQCRAQVLFDAAGWAFTRTQAYVSPSMQGTLDVVPNQLGIFDFLRPLFGDHDIELGDPSFDRAFVVRAAPSSVAQALLSAETRQQLGSLLPADLSILSFREGVVSMQWRGVAFEGGLLEAALNLVTTIAHAAQIQPTPYR